MSSDKCYAAIDLGTNSCRLLICNQDGKELCKETVSTRLGEGMYKNMAFTSEAIERGVKCFYDFKQIMDRYNIVKCRAIATASCRMAANGEEFIRKVYGESMIRLEVIAAYEEARLNLKGALSHVQGKTKYVVLFDMGGGSTEITLATNTSNTQILHTVSIPWGARNSSEAFELVEYTPENAGKLAREIKSYVDAFVRNSALDNYHEEICWVATSSMALRLISMINDFGMYDRDKADGLVMSKEEMDEAIGRVLAMSRAEMADNPYIGDKRSYIFIAGCIIYKTICDGLRLDKVVASLKTAKDGIVAELIEGDVKNG